MGIQNTLQQKTIPVICILGQNKGNKDLGCSNSWNNQENTENTDERNIES